MKRKVAMLLSVFVLSLAVGLLAPGALAYEEEYQHEEDTGCCLRWLSLDGWWHQLYVCHGCDGGTIGDDPAIPNNCRVSNDWSTICCESDGWWECDVYLN